MLTEEPVVVRSQQAPESRADAQHGKEFARYQLTRDRLDGAARDPYMERRRSGQREYFRSALQCIAAALEHGKGDSLRVCIRAGFLEQIKLLRIVDRQQTQQHRVKQAENRGVDPNGERERQNGDCRECRVAANDPQRILNILDESFER
jgi:hypothetical protein